MDNSTVRYLKRQYTVEEENEYMGKNKPVNHHIPTVSVCVATYQHVNYIKTCIDGILMQKVNFKYEIIIGEDGSQDGTREICQEYAKRHPDKIRLFLRNRDTSVYHDDNDSVIRLNGIWCRMSARGKYIALCEGDDYWTDPLKLQKQVDFLDTHADYILTCGGFESHYMDKTTITIEHGIVSQDQESREGFTFLLSDATKGWFTKTLTSLFRNRKDILDITGRYRYGRDIHLFYHLLKNGKGYYFKEVFGVYNMHHGGIHSLKSNSDKYAIHYYIYRELFYMNHDEYSRILYLRLCLNIINYKLSLLMKEKEFSLFSLLKESVMLIKTREDIKEFFRSLIPKQIKDVKHRLIST